MTRRLKQLPRRVVMIASLAAGVLALVIGTTAAASASPGPHLRPEFFTIQIDQHGSQVAAYGAVRGFGTDRTITPRLDVFDLNHPRGTVAVAHTKIGQPVIDWATCTGTLYEHGTWAFVGGTKADWGATGYGQFWLSETEQLATHHGHCDLKAPPVSFDVQVFAIGQAAR
jgi:hypothetical protein